MFSGLLLVGVLQYIALCTIAALSGHVLYMQAETVEASDWLQGHVNDRRDVIGGGTPASWVSYFFNVKITNNPFKRMGQHAIPCNDAMKITQFAKYEPSRPCSPCRSAQNSMWCCSSVIPLGNETTGCYHAPSMGQVPTHTDTVQSVVTM